MISGIGAGFWISNLWKYSKNVARIQKKLVIFKAKHEEQHHKIKHAVKQHTRLAQQQPLVEPILGVLAKAYRVQLQSDVSARAQVTTNFDPAVLPACVTLARAVDTDEFKMNRLKYHGRFTNVTGSGSKDITIALEKRLKTSTGAWTQVKLDTTDITGYFAFDEACKHHHYCYYGY